MKKQKALTLAKPFHLALISLVAVSALTTFAAGAISHFTHNAEAAPVSGTVNVRAVLDYSLTMSLGNAYSDCAALADNGAVVPINPTPNDTLYYNCLNALVNTDSPAGYNLSLQPSAPALPSGANTTPALAGTIA
ncbi:hypothetical protein FWH13_00470, partial [Candidatus Saccharibacteria bacterium]|nr:hypothetical protein [Candidatus Saccharibacteria bacterium]